MNRSKLTKRFENVQRTQQEFWKRWIEEVFPEKLRQSKWKREKRDLRVGDIVLRKDETAAGQTYKYAKVVKVHTSTDDKLRAADVEYKLPGESAFRTTTRPIHKLVLVVPVEEQNLEADKMREMPEPAEDEAAELTAGAPCGKGRQTASQAVPERESGESPTKVKTALLQRKMEDSQATPAPKQKKAAQRQAIAVTTPKEEAKMIDMTAGPRKRGRPKKDPIVHPPGPHKGSVLYPEEGVCADPVDEGAILGEGGGKPPSSDKERQLATDIVGEKT